MKRIIIIALFVSIVFSTLGFAETEQDYELRLRYDGKEISNDYVPYLYASSGDIYIQSRLVCESCDLELTWDNENRAILIGETGIEVAGSKEAVEIYINGKLAYLNGKKATAIIVDGVSYIPLKMLEQEFNISAGVSINRKLIDLTTHVNYGTDHKLTEMEISEEMEEMGEYKRADYIIARTFYDEKKDILIELRNLLLNDWKLDEVGELFFKIKKDSFNVSQKAAFLNKTKDLKDGGFVGTNFELENYEMGYEGLNSYFSENGIRNLMEKLLDGGYDEVIVKYYSLDNEVKYLCFIIPNYDGDEIYNRKILDRGQDLLIGYWTEEFPKRASNLSYEYRFNKMDDSFAFCSYWGGKGFRY